MKYIFLIIFLLGGAGYFGYTSIDEYYSNRVSGNITMVEKGRSGEAIIVALEPNTLKYGYSNLWDSWLTLAVATVVGFFVSVGLFFYCAPTLADVELKRKIKRLEEENERASSLYKSDLKEKIERAEHAELTVRTALNAEFEQAERLRKSAEHTEFDLHQERRQLEDDKKRFLDEIKTSKELQKKAESISSEQRAAKLHASQAMQRYKRKVDLLKTDSDALMKFVKQYHPEMINQH